MSEAAVGVPEELVNVDQSLVSLSRKCSNCGHAGHNSRTCLEIRECSTSEPQQKSNPAESNTTQAPAQQIEPATEQPSRDDDAASEYSADVFRETKKKGTRRPRYSSPSLAVCLQATLRTMIGSKAPPP